MKEEANNENKKKQKVALLIGLVTLLVAVLGATYAFFQINTDNESSNTNITGSTPDKSLVTLQGVTSNLHLNISSNDMSLNNVNNEYYATDVEEKSYEDNESDGTKTIVNVTLKGGEATTTYSCTAKLTVSRVTDPEEEADTMIGVLKPGDMFLQFKGNIISNILDLSMLKETGKIEYNLKFKVTGNTPEEIQAYIKLINKNESQNYLSGSKLNIDINTSDLKCNVYIPDPKIALLRADDSQGYLSEDLQGGMYRYQASFEEGDSSEMTNWICFGTTDNCGADETDSDNNNIPDGMDKYMYRIIGITDEGQMYLLKETFLKEGETNNFAWNSKDEISDCLGNKCEWPNVDLFKRLNGETSNGNPIFIDSSEYGYMAKNGDWYNLIEDHNWMYGDRNNDTSSIIYNGYEMYKIETGKTVTKRWWPDEEIQTTCSDDSLCTEKDYTWSKRTNATKIGLMYMHDIDYAYPGGNPENATNVKNSWIHFRKDGYNTSSNYEWLTTRYGVYSTSYTYVLARIVVNDGDLYSAHSHLDVENGVRPVFYLSASTKIKDGDGTKENPYILDVQEN